MKCIDFHFRKFPVMGIRLSGAFFRSFFRVNSCPLWIIEHLVGEKGDYSHVPGNAEMLWQKNCG